MNDKTFGRKPTLMKADDVIVGDFYLIKALEDSEVVVEQEWARADTEETVTIPKQGTLEQVTKVTVNSGVVLGFRK